MPAVWARARADLRARWKAWFLLALLVGVAAGAVIAAAAGARRTDTAYQRFSQAYRAPNIMLFGGTPDPTFAQLNVGQVSHLSPVSQVASGFLYAPAGTSSGRSGRGARPARILGAIIVFPNVPSVLPSAGAATGRPDDVPAGA